MTYRGYTIKQKSDGSYSVFIDDIEDMEDLPSEDAAKSFIDGKFDSPDALEKLKQYASKVKHLTRRQVDSYVYYDSNDFIDTDNVYMLAYKSKKDRISGVSQAKKAGLKLVDTTDNDEGILPYWAFVTPTESMDEDLQLNEVSTAMELDGTEPDSDIYEYLSDYEGITDKTQLISKIIDRIANSSDEPGSDYWNIYAATKSDEISTQYSYNVVHDLISNDLEDIFYPIIRGAMDNEVDVMDSIDDAIENDLDVKSELSYIDNEVSEYGDALTDIQDKEAQANQDTIDDAWRDARRL